MKRSINQATGFLLGAAFLLSACGGTQSPQTPPIILGPHQVLVSPDDTIYRIAYQHGVSTKALIEVNRLKPPYTVAAGQILVLPDAIKTDADPSQQGEDAAKEETEEEEMDSLKPLPLTAIPHEPEAGDRPDGLKSSQETPALRQENVLPQPDKPKSSSQSGSKAGVAKASGFVWPTPGKVIGKFGRSANKSGQDGILIEAPLGTDVKAVKAGKVIYVGNEIPRLGKLVLVQHKDGWISAYGHLKDKAKVLSGAAVSQGQVLGHVGKTGSTKTAQLYFELRQNKKPVDPLPFLGHKG